MEFFAATLKISACSFSLLGRLVYNEALLPDNNVFVISFQNLVIRFGVRHTESQRMHLRF